MLFNSLSFLLFFCIVIPLYYLVSHSYRWILLLTASYYFYMSWNPVYGLLLLFSTAVDYWVGLKMGALAEKCQRRKYLWLSLVCNLGLLFCFKYLNFFNASLAGVCHWFGLVYQVKQLNLLLPVGISFYTFQTLSYSLDVYRGKQPPERHFGYFALYVSFFPQLVAGPIERAAKLLPQLRQRHLLDYRNLTSGLKRMAWGFFKKLVIADKLAIFVDAVYSAPAQHRGIPLLTAILFFLYQLYCDFSGYSDIAIGTARVMGIQFTENFCQPFSSQSLTEFWSRWHITLYAWLKDYISKPLYKPLQFNNKNLKRAITVVVTFLLSGLWHGANWTFVIWGTLHGVFMSVSDLTQTVRKRLWGKLQLRPAGIIFNGGRIIVTYILVALSAAFFRAATVGEACYVLRHCLDGWQNWVNIGFLNTHLRGYGLGSFGLFMVGLAILLVESYHVMQRHPKLGALLWRMPTFCRWGCYYWLLLWILIFGEYGSREFVYFQF